MSLPRSQFAMDVIGKFDEEVQQCSPARLTQNSAPSFGRGISRMRLPCCRDQTSGERPCIQRPLRMPLVLAPIVSHEISRDRMMGSWPESTASALVVAYLISKLDVAQRRQAVGDHELPLARCEPFGIPSPAIVPLRRPAARLVDPGDECPLQICARRRQCLLQINPSPLGGGQ